MMRRLCAVLDEIADLNSGKSGTISGWCDAEMAHENPAQMALVGKT
jgi:hypothetical protein